MKGIVTKSRQWHAYLIIWLPIIYSLHQLKTIEITYVNVLIKSIYQNFLI